MALFSKEKQDVHITIEKEQPKKSILDIVENSSTEEDLDRDLMSSLLQFRKDTSSLDYLRNEIEQLLHEKDGEIKLMQGFANAIKQQKK